MYVFNQHQLITGATILGILLVAFFLSQWGANIIRKAFNKAKVDKTLSIFISKVFKWGILAISSLFVLEELGIETSSISVLLGSVGLAVGLAFQGTLGNIAAGLMLLIFRPYKVGDTISTSGSFGKVTEIDLFVTYIDTFDNRRIIIPNGQVFGKVIENVTFHPTRRVEVKVGVNYEADLNQTRSVLEEAIKDTKLALQEPKPAVILGDLQDSSVGWIVRIWVPTGDFTGAKQELTYQIKTKLDSASIDIPYPQLYVHTKESTNH